MYLNSKQYQHIHVFNGGSNSHKKMLASSSPMSYTLSLRTIPVFSPWRESQHEHIPGSCRSLPAPRGLTCVVHRDLYLRPDDVVPLLQAVGGDGGPLAARVDQQVVVLPQPFDAFAQKTEFRTRNLELAGAYSVLCDKMSFVRTSLVHTLTGHPERRKRSLKNEQ